MSRRAILVIVAIALGLFGTVSVSAYVKRADQRASAGEAVVNVLVAKSTIKSGTSGQDASAKGLLKFEGVSRSALPTGALGDITPVQTLVAASDIPAGQVLVSSMFINPQPTGVLTIPRGLMAVSVEVTELPARVAGFVVPGTTVAVFDKYNNAAQKGAAGDPTGSLTTRLLLPSAEVLAVGATPIGVTPAAGQPADATVPTTILTLAVDTRGAEKLVHAGQTGKLYFAVLGAGSKAGPDSGVNNNSLFN